MDPDDSLVLFRRAPRGLARRHLLAFAVELRDKVAGGRSFSCLITDDKELLKLNSTFLGKDYATDVLSFPSDGVPGHLGDIAISAERAAEEAGKHEYPVEEELKILMLHGVLHLNGMDHEKDRGEMAKTERQWRKKLNLPSGLIERARK
jgi:probable rRNA maturation factor